MSECKQEVKHWYDGFTFGKHADIYNPWSILNYLDTGKLGVYWEPEDFHLRVAGSRQMSASGYLKVLQLEFTEKTGRWDYCLTLTNKEVRIMFANMIRGWFEERDDSYNDFIKALLSDDLKAMNYYMNRVALATFSSFDVGKGPSEAAEPERFYHGFVLGLLVDLADRYTLTSNRESGFGRYDVVLEPKQGDDGIILEFKVQDTDDEKELTDTVKAALQQIEERKYETMLVSKGVPKERIRKYGFAFCGKKVLIGKAT